MCIVHRATRSAVLVAHPLLAVRFCKPIPRLLQRYVRKSAPPRVAALPQTHDRAPTCAGTRFAHWPPAGWRRRSEILRRGGGPCPGFRRASRKGFGRWNSISFRLYDLRLLARGRGTILISLVVVV